MRTFNFDLLRVIAILLVTNSHFDALYPDPRLGTGGALGNALFFALSGYGLAYSFRRNSVNFLAWYWRRFSRIYPSVWIVAVITLGWFAVKGEASQLNLFEEFVWPTRHWFVSAVMLFYVLIYSLLTLRHPDAFLQVALLLVVPYLVWYFGFLDLTAWSLESGYFKWIFYCQVLLLGCWVASHESMLRSSAPGREALCLAALVLVYFASKFGLSIARLWSFQIVLHAITLPILFLSFRVVAAPPVQEWVGVSRPGKLLVAASAISFEVYLTQHLFHQSHSLQSLPFPLGAFLALLGTLLMAILVSRLADQLRGAMTFIGLRLARARA